MMTQLGEAEADAPRATTQSTTTRAHVRRITLEVLLIAVGVFLGLLGEQWRQSREHGQLAAETLRRFRSELDANRQAVVAVKDRHVQELKAIQEYLNADSVTRKQLRYPFTGTHPAFLQYSAWDVALATQSLSYIDRDLATSIAQVYAIQRQLDDATHGITQVMYSKAGGQDIRSSLAPFAVYFGDCTFLEPRLGLKFDSILVRIDRALGDTPRS